MCTDKLFISLNEWCSTEDVICINIKNWAGYHMQIGMHVYLYLDSTYTLPIRAFCHCFTPVCPVWMEKVKSSWCILSDTSILQKKCDHSIRGLSFNQHRLMWTCEKVVKYREKHRRVLIMCHGLLIRQKRSGMMDSWQRFQMNTSNKCFLTKYCDNWISQLV